MEKNNNFNVYIQLYAAGFVSCVCMAISGDIKEKQIIVTFRIICFYYYHDLKSNLRDVEFNKILRHSRYKMTWLSTSKVIDTFISNNI